MTREEEIRRATLEFVSPRCQLCGIQGKCKDIVGYCIEQNSQEYGFVAGANWADENPKNIWHAPSEEPSKSYPIMIEIDDDIDPTYDVITVDGKDEKFWKFLASDRDITRWAYIKDLLPKGGAK